MEQGYQTMDFFGAQDRAKSNTTKLVLLFILALAFLCLGMFAIVDTVYVFSVKEENAPVTVQDFLNLDIFIYSVGGTLALVMGAMAIKSASLSGGGEKVATMLGGVKISPSTTDLEERKVLNVVEEMAIASGVPTPDVYLMPDDSINAFAAGTEIENAVIGVTRGCIHFLNRDELQGVIAHEYSHILNQDMKLNIRLMGIVFGIMVIAIIGRYLMEIAARSGAARSSRDNKGGAAFLVVGLSVFVLGSAGLFFSRWIKSSVSRQREFLADASAVQFTRNPAGIAGALKKIGGLSEGSSIRASGAEEASHMFFGNCMKSSLIFATHPPLKDRIRRIDPGFDGNFPAVSAPSPSEADSERRRQKRPASRATGTAGAGRQPPPIPIPGMPDIPAGQNIPLPGGAVIGGAILDEEHQRQIANSVKNAGGSVGNPGRLQLDYAAGLMEQIPEELEEAIHQPMTAMAAIFALLLDRTDESIRSTQLQLLEKSGPRGIPDETRKLQKFVQTLDRQFLLPLAEVSAPALRDLSPDQYQQFKQLTRGLIESDQAIDLFEYTLDRMIESALDTHFGLAGRRTVEFYNVNGVIPEVQIILSCLAYQGHRETAQAEAAYNAGRQALPNSNLKDRPILPKEACGLSDVDKAIEKIRRCAMPVRKEVVDAVGNTIAADGRITHVEAELMRAVCYGFGCPVPPFVGMEK